MAGLAETSAGCSGRINVPREALTRFDAVECGGGDALRCCSQTVWSFELIISKALFRINDPSLVVHVGQGGLRWPPDGHSLVIGTLQTAIPSRLAFRSKSDTKK